MNVWIKPKVSMRGNQNRPKTDEWVGQIAMLDAMESKQRVTAQSPNTPPGGHSKKVHKLEHPPL